VTSFILTFLVAFTLSLTLTPLAGRLSRRLGITSVPGGRRQHVKAIPKLGGVALYLAFVAAVVLAQFLPVERGDPQESIRLTGLLLGGTVLLIVGLIDDLYELSPLPQFLVQILATVIAIAHLIIIEYVNNPITGEWTPQFPTWLTIWVTVFWLMGMTNTVNWLDGLDGLAAGVTAIASVVLFINAAFRLSPPQESVALLPLALLGATLGFLPYNFFPARLFIGGSALWLGFTLGALSIIGGAKMAAVLLVMGGPILDVAWQIVSRIRRGRKPTAGDRGHLHFRLQDVGISQRKIVLAYYLFCAFFGTLTLVISSQLFKLVAMGVMVAIVAGVMLWLPRKMDDK
jgi:UDP-GlcNAc:undecaprenyl-phosphate GlcNAc-1-phosphate transferase